MRALTQADFLALWEQGRNMHPLDQGLLALHLSLPEADPELLADWPLGRRNRALMELRGACFGATLRGWISCGNCNEKLEFEFDGRAFANEETGEHVDQITLNGHVFRLPTSRDLAYVASAPDPESAAMMLLERCTVELDQFAPKIADWSEEDRESVGERMAVADPLAEIQLHFDCPACGESFDEPIDLPAFLWSEIEALARRLLADVHELARAYGWSEAEILSLSAARREFYLEMVRG